MADAVTGDATRPRPTPIDLGAIDARHAEAEAREHLLGTAIAETAVAVTGVHALGGPATVSLERASRRILATWSAAGITVGTNDGTTVVDLDVVVEYPHPIETVVNEIRHQVTKAAAQLTDSPLAIDITVTDVHGPFDDVPEGANP